MSDKQERINAAISDVIAARDAVDRTKVDAKTATAYHKDAQDDLRSAIKELEVARTAAA